MAPGKGESLEETVREFFYQDGYFALRSLALKVQSNSVTDVDVWLYRRTGSSRIRSIVDIKAKKSPKAFERVLFVLGLRAVLNVDAGYVATTDGSDAANRFASESGVQLITRNAVTSQKVSDGLEARLSLEELQDLIRSYAAQKLDGDWLERLHEARSGLISSNPFQAFNKAANQFKFFAERYLTRPQQEEAALRCAVHVASLCCIALDLAIQPFDFSSEVDRAENLYRGVIYGDSHSGRTVGTLNRVLGLVSASIPNGDVIRRQIVSSLDRQFADLRADIISEYFSQKVRSEELFESARRLDAVAFSRKLEPLAKLPSTTKAVLGILCDFCSIPRYRILGVQEREAVNPQGTLI